ncbi:MAG: hypothetical protein ACT4OK_20115 [Gemmobacter sp.]
MEITLAKIEAAEADVGRLEAEEQRMRTAANADGTIDPKEQADLDRILGKIRQGRDLVTRLRSEYEANKAIWDGKAGDLGTLQSQTSELVVWGEPQAAGFQTQIEEMASLSGAEQWKAATAALQASQAAILAPYAEYQRQLAAKGIYDPARADFDARVAAAAATDLRAAAVVSELDALALAGPAMDARTAERDYVGAQVLLDQATGTLENVETEITALAAARDAYLGHRADLDARIAQVRLNDFTTLQGRVDALITEVARIDELAAAFDFVAAQDATTTAVAEATTLQTEIETKRLARDGYDALLSGIEARLAEAAAEGATELADKLQEIEAKVAATQPQAEAEAEDYEAASAGLEQAATDLGGFEQLLADRRLYLERLADLMPKVIERGVSTDQNAFLDDALKRMADAQTAMEDAAKALDFTAALARLDEVATALADIEALIEAKHLEFNTERDIQQGRLEKFALTPYPEIIARTPVLQADIVAATAEAVAEHFDTAMDKLAGIATEIDLLEQELLRIETELLAKIEAIIAPVEAKLPSLEPPPSPSLPALKKLVGDIRAKMTSKTDLLKAVDEANDAARRAADLEKVHALMKDIEDKWGFEQDDVARQKVADLKASGDLNKLPTEARNYLVEKLMSGVVSDEDAAAIKDVWSQPKYVDPAFDKLDAPIRKQIVDRITNDPKVKQYEADWATMSDDDKKKALEYMCSIPCGPDGWNMGTLKSVKLEKVPTSDPDWGYGAYSGGDDEMTFNVDPTVEAKGWGEMMDTLTHEIGHKYQKKLTDDFKAGKIKPGDPLYDQAKSLKLADDYFNSNYDRYMDVYENTPEEAHSRKMGDEMKAGINAGRGGGP